jgi:uncharacterized membrane protein
MAENAINFFHLLATAVWIGGATFIHFILEPSSRLIDPQQAGTLYGIIAKRFSITAWISLLILLITGYLKTPDALLFDTSSDMGQTLTIKHILFISVIIIGLFITLAVVPGMRRASPKPGETPSQEFIRLRKRLSRLATTNLILGLLILITASALW